MEYSIYSQQATSIEQQDSTFDTELYHKLMAMVESLRGSRSRDSRTRPTSRDHPFEQPRQVARYPKHRPHSPCHDDYLTIDERAVYPRHRPQCPRHYDYLTVDEQVQYPRQKPHSPRHDGYLTMDEQVLGHSLIECLDMHEIAHDLRSKAVSEPRTTAMLRNIPNKYKLEKLIDQLEAFHNTYDFVYMPVDFRNGCNLGYAFLNFLTEEACARFIYCYDGATLPGFNSSKVCEVRLARVQGLGPNVRHLGQSQVIRCLDPKQQPIIYEGGKRIEFNAYCSKHHISPFEVGKGPKLREVKPKARRKSRKNTNTKDRGSLI